MTDQDKALKLEILDSVDKETIKQDAEGVYTAKQGRLVELRATPPVGVAMTSEEIEWTKSGSKLGTETLSLKIEREANTLKWVSISISPVSDKETYEAVSTNPKVQSSGEITVCALPSNPATSDNPSNPEETSSTTVAETAIGEYDEKLTYIVFAFMAAVSLALLSALSLMDWSLMKSGRQSMTHTTKDGETYIAYAGLLGDKVQVLAVAVCAICGILPTLTGAGMGVMETRGRLRKGGTPEDIFSARSAETADIGGIVEKFGDLMAKIKTVRALIVVVGFGVLLLTVAVMCSFLITPWRFVEDRSNESPSTGDAETSVTVSTSSAPNNGNQGG